MNKDKLCIYPLIISVILFILFMLIGMQKVGYHVDEMFTFSLSNQEYPYGLAPQIVSGKMYSGEALVKENLTVSNNTRFDFENVFLNQASDVHPPLYYMIISPVIPRYSPCQEFL